MTRHLAPVVLALLLALAGCGGDDEESAATTEAPPPPTAEPAPTEPETEAEPETTEPEPETTEPEPEPEPEPEGPAEAPTSPEDQPGGAGDEEPAQSLALLTAENGRITPRRVRVPAFISIRVELRSKDGEEYGLTVGGTTLRISEGLASASTTIDGLRPGEAVVAIPTGRGNRVRIEATAEPGP